MSVSTDTREMFWADAEAHRLDPATAHVIRDSKTPSGTVPISGLRGPIITDALYRTFKQRGLRVRYVFTIDDYDPMDSQAMRQREDMAAHMGKPLFAIPAPEGTGDFARYHAERFLATFAALGIRPEGIHWLRELYRSGALDRQIDLVLRNADVIRRVYAEVSNVVKDERWLPIGVICEVCGRLGTTYAHDYDGKTVAYDCRSDLVTWAAGCGNSGRISPFGGNAKLYWNLQWCAMWDHFGVTYEEGGKDLLTEGGSRDRANAVYREVWNKEPPLGLAHEFINVGGKKMSTSRPDEWKALGASAHELTGIYPPELVRFLMLRTDPKRHIDFDPTGQSLPKLLDEYDRCADAYLADRASDLARVWSLSQVNEAHPAPGFRVRFSIVADWLQIPSVDPRRKAAERKGSALTEDERGDLERRIALARVWLERWAPDDAKFEVRPALPGKAASLTDTQRAFLARAADAIDGSDADALQARLYDAARAAGLVDGEKVSRDAFAAIYVAFLGRPTGPKAAWLLTTLDPDFVRTRLREAAERPRVAS
ncbi:MAG: lysine--tRNA ligase [Chloroflexi bacterium]|nr:lysine--tRNA ligase [Chloroflexota bacterium]